MQPLEPIRTMPPKTPRKPSSPTDNTADNLRSVTLDAGGASHQAATEAGGTLTTRLGVPISDDQNTLRIGRRGPLLLEDFVFREKMFHFDHERIPERIVHARGFGAHGFFENYKSLANLTKADLFQRPGEKTPAFVRFSTVAGNKGSADLARDVRGFAVKLYTKQGNWDIVGNNIPVFFIQDPIKFPDLVHAAKQEPDRAFPQASTAHDNFWDFISLVPESMHMVMWTMSDRAIPRSFRFMEGFGVHTFRLVDAKNKSRFVKFHWKPKLGLQSVVWNEAVKINGADPDFHRRDLWNAIQMGDFPEWELGLQVFDEALAEKLPFDVLDATKIVPEELVPLKPVGRLVLNRNPDNFFAETEQVAFCAAHVVPGIDFTNDPLLAGRIHSYVDTQISRLGGPNFHEIPVNAPVAQVHNNQRDGMHRQAIHRGRVAYEPNSLGGGCPFQAGVAGFRSFPEPVAEDKVRGKPERFADHYTQATLFYRSQSAIEQAHIRRGFRFELTKVQVPAIRERMVASLANVDQDLARTLAAELGMDMPKPLPRALKNPTQPEVTSSKALSLFARPGDGSIRTRRIAIFVAEGVDGEAARTLHEELLRQGAVPRFIGARLGSVNTDDGTELEVSVTFETMPSVLFDAVVVPGGDAAVAALANAGQALEFLKDQYRHAKPMLALGAGAELLEQAKIPATLPSGKPDPGIIIEKEQGAETVLARWVAAIARHRHHEREIDPPLV